eukprot:GFUD01132619.1.p1 GENE.GFUD01132619.1~~GFUD01132619.1.p1  ORF type:complete len:198 (-),score=75.04 GFUD01132619.1:3-509(-)
MDRSDCNEEEVNKSKRKDTPTYTHIPEKGNIFQAQGSQCIISFSVDEVDEPEEEETDEDCQLSANKIKVIETTFDRPGRSSFRAQRGLRRGSSVQFSEEPLIVDTDDAANANDAADQDNAEENTKQNDDLGLTEEDFVKLNVGLRSKIRRDSFDKTPIKNDQLLVPKE